MRPSRFIFYLEWLRTMEDAELSKVEKSRLIDAIVTYADTGAAPQLPRLLTAIFSPIKATLDRDMEKYEKKAATNRANGSHGGRPRAEKPTETHENPLGYFENPEKPTETQWRNNINIDKNNNISYAAEPTEEEKRVLYIIFFWRNFRDPSGELQKFLDYNAQRKWKALDTPGKRMTSASSDWKPADSNPRVKQQFLDTWLALYQRLKTTVPDIADQMIDVNSKCTFYDNKAKIHARKKVREYIEQNRPPEIMAYIGNFQLTTAQS